ncbi:MAG: MTAP family purine nucleoside phosphorylase [Gammaproteobacteria bacterium]|jgi:5'-methylthioadenosine phosphorylase
MIGIFGGKGILDILDNVTENHISSKYGTPSDVVYTGTVKGKKIAFMKRHGINHTIPSHKVNYRANIDVFRLIGVKRIIAPNIVGSLNSSMPIGSVVINDQFINMAFGREDTYFNGPNVHHLSSADPYCPEMRKIAIEEISKYGKIPMKETGTVVITHGPRFESRAEAEFFRLIGGDILNHSQYPEVFLAREAGLCYINLSFVSNMVADMKNTDVGFTVKDSENKGYELREHTNNILNLLVQKIDSNHNCCADHVTQGKL